MVKNKLLSLFITSILLCGLVGVFLNPECSVQAQTSYVLGSQVVGGTTLHSAYYNILGSSFTMPTSGSITNVTVYLSFSNSFTFSGACAVYTTTGLNLVNSTSSRSITVTGASSNGWYTFDFASSIVLNATISYTLVFWSNSDVYVPVNYAGSTNQSISKFPWYTSFPSTLTSVDYLSVCYPIYTVYGYNTMVSSNPAVEADITLNGTDYSTPAYFSLVNGNYTFTAESSLVYNDAGYVFANYTVNGTTTYTDASITLNISASTTIQVNYATYTTGLYHFYGPYNETSGLLLNDTVLVVAHYIDGANYEFTLNQTWLYPPDYQVVYFEFIFSDNNTRRYWVDPSELISSIYVFKADDPTIYTINFLDYTGMLNTYPYVTAKTYINGTLMTVEKSKVDEQNSFSMSLIEGEKYQLTIGNDEYSFVYGDLLVTAINSIQLTLRSVDLPTETLLIYKYLTFYAYRDYTTNSILFFYNDTKLDTDSLTLIIYDDSNVMNYHTVYTADTVTLNWTDAENEVAYNIQVVVEHGEYGEVEWSQYLAPDFGSSVAMFDMSFLGDWSFDITYLFPAILLLLLCCCFSALNAEVAAIIVSLVAIFLTIMGWLPIPAGSLVTAFSLAVLMALVFNKRRVQAY